MQVWNTLGLISRSSDKSSSPRIVSRRSILHNRCNDGGGSNRIRSCRSLPMNGSPWPTPVSRNRLRSEIHAGCPPRCIPALPAGSLGLAHPQHRKPCYLPVFGRALRSRWDIHFFFVPMLRRSSRSCCLILNNNEKNYRRVSRPVNPGMVHSLLVVAVGAMVMGLCMKG